MNRSKLDIAAVILKISKHGQSPTKVTWIATKLALLYINSIHNYNNMYDGNRPLIIGVFSDADKAGCWEVRKEPCDPC